MTPLESLAVELEGALRVALGLLELGDVGTVFRARGERSAYLATVGRGRVAIRAADAELEGEICDSCSTRFPWDGRGALHCAECKQGAAEFIANTYGGER